MTRFVQFGYPIAFVLALLASSFYFIAESDQVELLWSRIALLFYLAGLILSLARIPQIKRFFLEAEPPYRLAALRFFLCLFLLAYLLSGQLTPPAHDQEIVSLPYANWFEFIFFPVSEYFYQASVYLGIVCAAFGLLGIWVRPFLLLLSIILLYTIGVHQFFGKVSHSHHLVWFTCLLGLSPCDDAISVKWLINRFYKRLSTPRANISYGLALRYIWLLLGLIFFFPGFWKIWAQGLDWIFTNNLQLHIFDKWQQMPEGWEPDLPIYQYPLLYKSGALFTVLFEVSFIFLLFNRYTRVLAFVAAVIFPIASSLAIGIGFVDLGLVSLVSLCAWPHIQTNGQIPVQTKNKIIIPVASFMLIINSWFGFANIDSWPFSVYPLFAWDVQETYQSVAFRGYVQNDSRLLSKKKVKAKYEPHDYNNWEGKVISAYEAGDTVKLKQSAKQLINLFPDSTKRKYKRIDVLLIEKDIDPQCTGEECIHDQEVIYSEKKLK